MKDILLITGTLVWLFWGFVFLIYALRKLDTYLHRKRIEREKKITPGLNLQEYFQKERMN